VFIGPCLVEARETIDLTEDSPKKKVRASCKTKASRKRKGNADTSKRSGNGEGTRKAAGSSAASSGEGRVKILSDSKKCVTSRAFKAAEKVALDAGQDKAASLAAGRAASRLAGVRWVAEHT
jgi:hypothetical protein